MLGFENQKVVMADGIDTHCLGFSVGSHAALLGKGQHQLAEPGQFSCRVTLTQDGELEFVPSFLAPKTVSALTSQPWITSI